MKTLIEYVYDLIDDVDEKTSDTKLVNRMKRYFNDGYKMLSGKDILTKEVELTINNGVATIPSDKYKILQVYFDNKPIDYDIENGKIITDKDGTIKLIYAYIPPILVDNDKPLVNESNLDYIFNYVKYRHFIREEEFELSNEYLRQYRSFTIYSPSRYEDIIGVY